MAGQESPAHRSLYAEISLSGTTKNKHSIVSSALLHQSYGLTNTIRICNNKTHRYSLEKTEYSIDWTVFLKYWDLPPPFHAVADGLHLCT